MKAPKLKWKPSVYPNVERVDAGDMVFVINENGHWCVFWCGCCTTDGYCKTTKAAKAACQRVFAKQWRAMMKAGE